MANDPPPVAQRTPRIAALERELEELYRVEEVLVAAALAAGQSVYRSTSAPPAVVLGVRVADKVLARRDQRRRCQALPGEARAAGGVGRMMILPQRGTSGVRQITAA
jgi:hypothetical protein